MHRQGAPPCRVLVRIVYASSHATGAPFHPRQPLFPPFHLRRPFFPPFLREHPSSFFISLFLSAACAHCPRLPLVLATLRLFFFLFALLRSCKPYPTLRIIPFRALYRAIYISRRKKRGGLAPPIPTQDRSLPSFEGGEAPPPLVSLVYVCTRSRLQPFVREQPGKGSLGGLDFFQVPSCWNSTRLPCRRCEKERERERGSVLHLSELLSAATSASTTSIFFSLPTRGSSNRDALCPAFYPPDGHLRVLHLVCFRLRVTPSLRYSRPSNDEIKGTSIRQRSRFPEKWTASSRKVGKIVRSDRGKK